MDAEEGRERQRISSSSRRRQRSQRWSMSSQRLEYIVKLLMMPVMSHGQSFDRDDAALLEEYLTEAGIRLLETGGALPNFTEIGMLLQSCACNYSRKVDHLLHLVGRLRETLCGVDEAAPEPGAEPSPRRRRGASDSGLGSDFAAIVLTPAPQTARRAPPPAGPPPALPRQYSELQPREPRPDRELHSYLDGETIGSLDDFHLTRRTQRGHLVDELEADDEEEEEEPAQPLSLLQLQAAIERNAAGSPPPAPPATPPPASPRSPSPPPPDLAPLAASTPLQTPLRVLKRERTIPSVEHVITLETNAELELVEREFSVRESWVRRAVGARSDALLKRRRRLRAAREPTDFRGYNSSWMDINGFLGWAAAESSLGNSEVLATARRLSAALLSAESDDDGFFERGSSLSPSQPDTPAPLANVGAGEASSSAGAAGALSWQEEVARRAAVARPLHLGSLARDVRRALLPHAEPVPWRALLQMVRGTQPQPSHVLLDVLGKASRGELEVLHGAPGSVGDFSVRLRRAAEGEAGVPPPDP